MDYEALHREVKFNTSRSSGSGGQHVNKVESRVELVFDLDGSAVLSDGQKGRLREALKHRLNQRGELRLSSQRHRSQHRNKEEVLRRFDECVKRALRPRKKRKGPKARIANPEKRLRAKRRRSEKKARRGPVRRDDY